MTGLLLKDLYELKKLWFQPKFLFISVAILTVGMLFLNSSAILISIFAAVFLINTIQTLFVNDKKSRWTLFIQTTTISSGKIVSARYFLSIIVCFIATVINAVVSLLLWLVYHELSLKEYLIVSLIFLTVIFIYVAIILPFFYAFDENGLTISVLLVALIAFLVFRIPGAITMIINFFQTNTTNFLSLIGVVIVFCLGGLSFLSSLIIFHRKG